MHNTYNIYKIRHERLNDLKQKLDAVGLVEQKTLKSKDYSMTFYFSEKVEGNPIWWWQTYQDFFKDGIEEPKNYFYFGVLLCSDAKNAERIYAVSLGKAHFYLAKFINADFGINLAVRMADENTILLKKSRYFAGSKRQDVSSYERFQKDSYEPGESVDHLKLKASDKEIWGKKNIIFADSIQMDMDIHPLNLSSVFEQIDAHAVKDEIIQLPKLEQVESELGGELDGLLLASLRDENGKVNVEEFTVHGVAICFSFHDYEYRLSAKKSGQDKYHKKNIGNVLEISAIREFLEEYTDVVDVNSIRVQFHNDELGSFSKGLKEVLDLPVLHDNSHYFLKNGEWYKFNQIFMDYLKRSLENIELIKTVALSEKDYLAWKTEKERKILAEEEVDDKVLYRESYFNKKLCVDHGYTLLDRQLTQIQSLSEGRQKYKVEIADLYKNEEIISVKISEANHDLIYNIEQSKDSVELIMRNAIEFEHQLTSAGLWFVFEGDVEKITDFNSVQFLLAIEAWRKLVQSFNLKPKIYISKHDLA
ncbi:DUF6119 family protein [Burkholderia sp. LMU1-1-1.1]|uniref:DUF6119 family protein n=1 Tax=Burkholderia sp. LMU1-1-1.1 TaxID=3135266 RepID=UPI003435DA4F